MYFQIKPFYKMKDSILFNDFQTVSRAEWQAQIEKDLKGKPYSDLRWHLGEDFVIEPFYQAEDRPQAQKAFVFDNDWAISETIEVIDEDYKAANALALTALMGGANALCFIIHHGTSAAEMEVLLHKIELSYIATHFFYIGKKLHNAQKKMEHFYTIAQKRGENTQTLKGSISIAPLGKTPNWDKVAAFTQWISAHLPDFQAISINGQPFHTEPQYVAEELAQILQQTNSYFHQLSERNIALSDIHSTLQILISIDKSYFINIAKIRALKILYLNLAKAYGIENCTLPIISANFNSLSFDKDFNTNMIRATTMALSAASAGVNCLTVLPSDHQESPFARRIARNVQHLLKMESYMEKVSDPSAGSYYIEQLTEQIATKSWAIFQKNS
jgi:methylmalonyl-CoA mutase